MSKLKAEHDDEYDHFSKEAIDEALEELKSIGLEYYKRLNNKRLKNRKSNLKLHYLCLCQGAALYYANTNPEYRGVKDFDVWLFVSGYNKNYSSRKPKNEKIIVQCKPKKVDLLIYNSEALKNSNSLIKVLQNDRRRKTARCLLDKAIIELSPYKKILYVNEKYSDNSNC
jgi:hypothetical protein